MAKTAKITIDISTDPRIAGRYFVDLRDITGGANRQMTTRTLDAAQAIAFIAEATAAAATAGVRMLVDDLTGDFITHVADDGTHLGIRAASLA